MFTEEEREEIRNKVIERAKNDERIGGAAITGSASINNQDRWSDIDLAFGVKDETKVSEVLDDFTGILFKDYAALDYLDVLSGKWIYRVFFLPNTLQVDLAFVPLQEFGAKAPTFKLLFGKENAVSQVSKPATKDLIGWAWLYAIHIRTCIAREKYWQCEYMLTSMRNEIIALMCLRHDLPTRQGRGVDRLPQKLLEPLKRTFVQSLEKHELVRCFAILTDELLKEIRIVDRELEKRLSEPLRLLCSQVNTVY